MLKQNSLFNLLFVGLTIFIFQSCSKSNDPKPKKEEEVFTLEYTVDGSRMTINGNMDSIGMNGKGAGAWFTKRVNFSNGEDVPSYALYGQKNINEQIYFCIDTKTLETKSYRIPGGIHVGYNSVNLMSFLKVYSNLGDQSYLDVTITKITGRTISATFSGKLAEVTGKHTDVNGNTVLDCVYHELTNGKLTNAQFIP